MENENFRPVIARIWEDIKKSCEKSGRTLREVSLMAVSKTQAAERVLAMAESGLSHFGENRVQEAAAKREAVKKVGVWELIGPLQRNKAKLALETFERIQTVDRASLAAELEKQCGKLGIERYPVLMQVNISEDEAKHGAAADEAEALAVRILEGGVLQLEGLMTIGRFTDEELEIRKCFSGLRELRDRLQPRLGLPLRELSMGMSSDYEWAIEEGSTLVRVGSGLFGRRESSK